MNTTMNFLKKAIFILLLFLFSGGLQAQDPPPPPPGDHGSSGNVPGGGAPVGNGLTLLLLLGAGYGVKKWRQKSNEATME